LRTVTIERNDIMGIIEMEEDKLYPLTDETAAGICAVIKNNIPNTIDQGGHLQTLPPPGAG
jgi:hypothetical protein